MNDDDDPRCMECDGLYRCTGPEHRYVTAYDMKQPAKALSPHWVDPLLVQDTNTKNKETTR